MHGTITPQGKVATPVSVVLGNGQPLTRTLTVPGGGRPKISLEVETLAPRELLPSAAELAAAKDPLRLTELALARIALANQYAQYLASPDQLGTNRTSYAYRPPRRARSARGSSRPRVARATRSRSCSPRCSARPPSAGSRCSGPTPSCRLVDQPALPRV